MTLRLLPLLLVLGSALVAGCGGGSGGGGNEGDLTKYLPTDSVLVASVDFDQAREETGAAKNADVLDLDIGRSGSSVQSPAFALSDAASQAIPPMRVALTTLRTDDPLLKALDGTKVHAAASSQAGPSDGWVAAIDTDLSFGDLATALTKAGWKRDGDTVTNPEPNPVAAVSDAGDGVILMTGTSQKPQSLIDEPPGGPAGVSDFLDGADSSVRLVVPATKGSTCLKSLGGWETANGKSGAFRLTVDGDADVKRLDATKLSHDINTGSPKTDGGRVTVPFTTTGTNPLTRPVLQSIETLSIPAAYDCP